MNADGIFPFVRTDILLTTIVKKNERNIERRIIRNFAALWKMKDLIKNWMNCSGCFNG